MISSRHTSKHVATGRRRLATDQRPVCQRVERLSRLSTAGRRRLFILIIVRHHCEVTNASPVPRRLRTPTWFDARLLLGLLLVIGSVLLGAVVVSRADSTKPVLAMSHDLAAGTIVTAADVHTQRVKLGASAPGYVTVSNDAVGRTLTRPLSAGELLPRTAVRAASTTDTTVPISVRPENAPELARGQRIGVWVSTTYCQAVLVLGDVAVQSVRDAGSGLSATSFEGVVVRVSQPLAARVFSALGIEGAVIRIGVLSGPPNLRANDALPSLATCKRPTGSA